MAYSSSDLFGSKSVIFVLLLLLTVNISRGGCPRKCQCFRAGPSPEDWLRCDNGALASWPKVSKTREVVMIRNSQLRELPLNPFGKSTFSEVKYVFLDNNQITSLSESAFSIPMHLSTVSLMDNQLATLSTSWFKGANTVKKLNLDRNYLIELETDTFREMYRLKYLSITDNTITTLRDRAFMGLAELRELYLNNNRIVELSDNALQGFRDIRKIVLERNSIHTIGDLAFSSLFHLEELLMKGNSLREVRSEWFDDLGKLRVLDLSGNRISRIANGAFAQMHNLQVLDISNNQLSVMGEGKMEGLENLKELKAANNREVAMRPGSFGELRNLRMMDLRNTSSGIGATMFRSDGNMTRLEKAKKLMLSGLTEMPVDLLSLAPNLEVLMITNSNISVIPNNAFVNNRYLREIHLSNIGISTVGEDALLPLRKLKKFDISGNTLTGLSDITMPYHRNLAICFHGNPWHCDCSSSWLTKWLQRRGGRWCKGSRPVCQTPKYLEGHNLWEVRDEGC